MTKQIKGTEIAEYYKTNSTEDSFIDSIYEEIKDKTFIETDVDIQDIIKDDTHFSEYLEQFISNKEYNDHNLEDINNKRIILDSDNVVLDGYIRIALNSIWGSGQVSAFKEKSDKTIVTIIRYIDNNFLDLSINGKEYRYENISPYTKEKITSYIKYDNYSSLFKALKDNLIK